MSEASTRRGVPFVVAAVFLMSLQDALFKFLSADIVLWQVFTLRGLLATVILLFVVKLLGGDRRTWRAAFRPWLLARSVLFALMFVSFYASIAILELATAAASYYTAPIFIVLLSAVLLREKIGIRGWCAVATGFVGVLTILKPSTESFDVRALIPVFSGFCYALASIIVRTKCRDEHPAALVVSLNTVLMMLGIAASALLMILQLSPETVGAHPYLLGGWTTLGLGAQVWGVISILAVITVVSAYLLVKAYQLSAPNLVAPFDYCYLVFAVFWGVLLFSEVPDSVSVAGIALIALGGMISIK